jgi:hypothetical protein
MNFNWMLLEVEHRMMVDNFAKQQREITRQAELERWFREAAKQAPNRVQRNLRSLALLLVAAVLIAGLLVL